MDGPVDETFRADLQRVNKSQRISYLVTEDNLKGGVTKRLTGHLLSGKRNLMEPLIPFLLSLYAILPQHELQGLVIPFYGAFSLCMVCTGSNLVNTLIPTSDRLLEGVRDKFDDWSDCISIGTPKCEKKQLPHNRFCMGITEGNCFGMTSRHIHEI